MRNRYVRRVAGLCAAAFVLSSAGCGMGRDRIGQEAAVQDQSADQDQSGNQEDTGASAGEKEPGDREVRETEPAFQVGTLGDDYLLPHAGEHVYTQEELSGMTAEELRLARNEIYARHGRRFKSDDLNRYFSGKSWYQGTTDPDSFDSGILNQNERDNLRMLQKAEEGKTVCVIPKIGMEEFPRIDGSTATLPLSQAIYRMATGATEQEAEAAVTHGKTTAAWISLIRGGDGQGWGADLVIAYEPGDRVDQELKETGVKIIKKPIGRDALVFLANKSNPVRSLTREQMVDIYSGTIKNWKDVGGRDKAIQAFQRPEDSGSQNMMDKLVMKGKKMADAPRDYVVSEMGELLEEVSSYDDTGDALGYSVYYYARNMYQKPELTFMGIDGVMPSSETIRDGSYPYVNDFYAAIRADEPKDSKAYQLFAWLTGDDGQSLINGLGYVGIKDASKELPQELGESGGKAEFDASIPLPEGNVILASGSYLYGENGIAVFDSRMRLLQFMSHAQMWDSDQFMECSRDAVISVLDSRTGEHSDYSVRENRLIGRTRDQNGDGEPSVYDLVTTFPEDHPQLLKQYGVTREQVRTCYYWDSADPVICITEGNAEHYYDAYGRFLLDFDMEGRTEEELPYRYVVPVDEHTAYIRLDSRQGESGPMEPEYRIYRDGILFKELADDQNGDIYDIRPDFYTRSSGNYLYFYNYQDEPCAKFLYGYYGND